MLNINSLTEEQLANPETLKAIKQEAYDLIDHFMAPESKKLAEQLEQTLTVTAGLESKAPEIYKQYRGLILYLQLMALPTLDNDSILDLIKNYFLHSINAGIDLNERMTGKMYSIPDLAWPDYAEKLIGALKQNSQKIGHRPILISGENTPQQPIIRNWIRDYDRTYGPEKQTTIQQEEYLSRNPNAQLLNEEEKFKLRNVLQFYDNLKPIPLSVIDKTFKELGIDKELTEEFSAAGEGLAPLPPASEYRVHEEMKPDRYLEPTEAGEIPRYRPSAAPSPSGYGEQAPAPPLLRRSLGEGEPPTQQPSMPPPPPLSPPIQPPNILNLKEQQYRPSPLLPTAQPKSPYLEPIESIEARDIEANEKPSSGPPTYTPPPMPPQPTPPPAPPPPSPSGYGGQTPVSTPSAPPRPESPWPPQTPRPPEPKLDGNIVDLKNLDNK